ncbi:MAG: hypothetical protein GTO55_01725 [Armatimonadetes bacterium]|nr:hypothetical protein [Armatimonadota bacterium]NIM22996.1 hypothetical protein [Armatimonadota bacterium]NIM66867.1 hypothetical protein [Armatimonadota bacterium]NIN05054.1 hypothetical protein [Armatimonadota bacterium]NIO76365.1 hypothetical protein [Armatimonadota bacterium]
MDEEVKSLLQRAVKNLVSLEVTLFFHSHPEQPNDVEDLCRRMGCEPATVANALRDLANAGVVECFQLGAGRYEIYSYTHNTTVRSAVDRLSHCYHDDPKSRAEIIQHIISSSIRSGCEQGRSAPANSTHTP